MNFNNIVLGALNCIRKIDKVDLNNGINKYFDILNKYTFYKLSKKKYNTQSLAIKTNYLPLLIALISKPTYKV